MQTGEVSVSLTFRVQPTSDDLSHCKYEVVDPDGDVYFFVDSLEEAEREVTMWFQDITSIEKFSWSSQERS